MAYAKSKAAVGLYITKGSVTVAQVKPTLHGPRLIKSARVEIKSEQPKREELIKVINEAFAKAAIESKEVVSGLAGKEVMIRFFRMPHMPKEEQRSAVRFEAKKYIPFRIEEVASNSRIIEKKGEPKTEVIFVACKKDYINSHLSLLREAGLTPKVLESASLSLLRALYSTGQIKRTETVAVVNIDSSNAEMTVVCDGIPYLSRALTLNIGDAQSLLDSLLGEIQLSFDYYRRQFPGDSINRIILYAAAELKEADESLSKELRIPVVRANPVEALGGKQYSSAEFSIACGLALRRLVKPQSLEIELYTEEEKVPEEKRKLIKATVTASLPAILILVALYLFMSKGVAELKTKLNETKQARTRTDLIPFDASSSEIENIKIKISKKLGVLKRLIDGRIYWTAKFDELSKILPEGIWFREIALKENISEGARRIQRSFSLKASTFLEDASSELELANKFLSSLKNNKRFFEGFQEAELTSVSRGESEGFQVTNFEIFCYRRR